MLHVESFFERPGVWRQNSYLTVALAIVLGVTTGSFVMISPRLGLIVALVFLLLSIILPKPEYGLFLIVIFLPFERLIPLNKDFGIIKLIMIVTLFAWLVRLFKRKSTQVNLREPSSLFLSLFAATAVLSLIQAKNLSMGLDRVVTLFLLIGLYYMVVDLVIDQRTLDTTLMLLACSGIVSSLLTLAQFIQNGGQRTGGLYMEPSSSAINLLALLPLVFIFISKEGARFSPIFWIGSFTIIAAVIATLSRGPMIALLVVLIMSMRKRLIHRRLKQALSLLVIVAVLSLPFLWYMNPRLSLSAIQNDGGSGRLSLWQGGQEIMKDHWLFGIGLGNYRFVYFKYSLVSKGLPAGYTVKLVAHNVPIETAVETGIFGLIFLTMFLFFLLRKSYVNYRRLLDIDRNQALIISMLSISIIGFLVGSLANSILYLKIIWLLLALASAQSNLATRDGRQNQMLLIG